MSEPVRPARARRWPLAIALLLLGSLGIAAVWILVADARNAQSSWMAVVAAVDAAWILRLTRARPGMLRALAGLLATALTIVVAGFGIKTSTQLEADRGPRGELPASSRIGLFRIYERHDEEIVLGEDDKHLDFRISLLVRATAPGSAAPRARRPRWSPLSRPPSWHGNRRCRDSSARRTATSAHGTTGRNRRGCRRGRAAGARPRHGA